MTLLSIRRTRVTVDARRRCLLLLLLPLLGLVAACTSLRRSPGLMARHPADAGLGEHPPVCTDCHEARDDTFVWVQFNHTAGFGTGHKRQAKQNEQVCFMCHQRNDCSDCHATRVELKPSLKNRHRTSRQMPHRGDYLARHRIEGRVDPISCVRCHRNPKTSMTCRKCHG